MKRQSCLFDDIIDRSNIRLAFLKALRGNRSSPGAIAFCRDTERSLNLVQESLANPAFDWGGYRSFIITDPKLRIISTAPFEQRVMHHALMNVLEPVLDRPMIRNSFACRKGKGTHAAVLYAFRQCRSHGHFLKLDVRKYFDSINHETLAAILLRRIKDRRVMALLRGIIASYETSPGTGVPIGNLTSQFFANLYLAGMDHYILEQLRPAAYCRYMDDFVLWADSPSELKTMYAAEHLRLTLKQPVYGKTAIGLPFLGFLIQSGGIYLLRKSKRRVIEKMEAITASLADGEITEEQAAERALSVLAAIRLARTNGLRNMVCNGGRRRAVTG
jgi:hypothetical protein